MIPNTLITLIDIIEFNKDIQYIVNDGGTKNEVWIESISIVNNQIRCVLTPIINQDRVVVGDIVSSDIRVLLLLCNISPSFVADIRPDIMADNRPKWMADNRPETTVKHKPNMLADCKPNWMGDNRPEWMGDNRPLLAKRVKVVPQHILDLIG